MWKLKKKNVKLKKKKKMWKLKKKKCEIKKKKKKMWKLKKKKKKKPWCVLIIIPYTSLYLPYTIAYTDCIHLKEGSLNRVLYAISIPDSFFRSDDKVRGRRHRHFIFASYQQLQFLAWAKSWYIDGTFKLCRQPFTQPPTISLSIKHEDHAKQVPL